VTSAAGGMPTSLFRMGSGSLHTLAWTFDFIWKRPG